MITVSQVFFLKTPTLAFLPIFKIGRYANVGISANIGISANLKIGISANVGISANLKIGRNANFHFAAQYINFERSWREIS